MHADLSHTTLLWLPLTVGVYYAALRLQQFAGTPAINPTLVSVAVIASLLLLTHVNYQDYFQAVSILHYLLGVTIVALAVPLHKNLGSLERGMSRALAALLAGSLASFGVGVLCAYLMHASPSLLLSLAPKAATAAVSMEIAQSIGGIPALAACLTILTGMTGAVIGPALLTACNVQSPIARGVALGTASHGIATARAFTESQLTGCWASVALTINAVVTALMVPTLIHLVKWAANLF
jgi:predicted murein hydrolase (TIGR00659 family)